MADLFTATRKWYEVILLASEFPEADSRWQRAFTPAGWKRLFQERRFLKRKEYQILTVSLALCSHRLGSRDTRESLGYITEAMELDPAFFRAFRGDSIVRETLAFLETHRGPLDQTHEARSTDPPRPTPMASKAAGASGRHDGIAGSIATLRTSSDIPELVSAIERLARFGDEIVAKVFFVAMLKIPSGSDKRGVNALAEAQKRLRGEARRYYQTRKDTPVVAVLGEIGQELLDAEGTSRADMKELALLYADVFGR